MTTTDDASERPPGRRYLVEVAQEGQAWEVGWDRRLGGFYAQQITLLRDGTIVDTDVRIFEPAAFDALGDRIGRTLPANVATELHKDALAHPAGVDTATMHADWAASIYRQLGIAPRWTLPAAPVAEFIDEHVADWGDRPRLDVALGMGLDRDLAAGLLDGSLEALSVRQIAHVCQTLHCSPFDMWDTDLARSILHIYGPEHWPTHIEPLRDRPRLQLVTPTSVRYDGGSSPHPPTPDRTAAGSLVTAYRDGGLVAVDPNGAVLEPDQVTSGRAEAYAYYQAFHQAADPHPTTNGPSTLTEHATNLRDQLAEPFGPDVELVRLTRPDGQESWLAWNRGLREWEPSNDPRTAFPGDRHDILDPGPFTKPESCQRPTITPALAEPDRYSAGADVIVTGYQHTRTLAVGPDATKPVGDTSPIHANHDYHFAFAQITRPSIYPLLGQDEISAGAGVNPHLASVATYRVTDTDTGRPTKPTGIDLVRISPTTDGSYQPGPETWLGWDHHTNTWELWDDPRHTYPGRPADVLDPGEHVPPEQWNAAMESAAIEAHDTQRFTDLGGAGHLPDGHEWTHRWTGETPTIDEPGLEL